MSAAKIAFVLTGSIAAPKACEVVSQLVQRGHQVRTVLTDSARNFVGASTLEGLTGQPVLGDLFAPGAALEHIELGRWADLVVVCPATANTLNRFAAGIADDFAGALFLARDPAKPFIMAPAMNPAMWQHPATQASVARLRDWGVRLVPVGFGRTACGDEGAGRMAESREVLAFIESAVARTECGLRILVTSGPTSEPVDRVRVLTNTSTGRTGAGIAANLALRGHAVTLLRGAGSAPAPDFVRSESFGTVAELDAALTRHLGNEDFDAVIHAAAVSDFVIDRVEIDGTALLAFPGKLDSSRPPVLRLKRAPKLVESLRGRSRNPLVKVVAFKLTAGDHEPAGAVQSLLARSAADWVVHNDLGARADGERFPATIHAADGSVAARCATRTELALALDTLLSAAPVAPSFSTP